HLVEHPVEDGRPRRVAEKAAFVESLLHLAHEHRHEDALDGRRGLLRVHAADPVRLASAVDPAERVHHWISSSAWRAPFALSMVRMVVRWGGETRSELSARGSSPAETVPGIWRISTPRSATLTSDRGTTTVRPRSESALGCETSGASVTEIARLPW